MKYNGKPYRTIWLGSNGWIVEVIDQRRLPHEFEIVRLKGLDDTAFAIRAMVVRGAPLIGATAAYGVALAMRADASDTALQHAYDTLLATRPTAVNLRWALDQMRETLQALPAEERVAAAYRQAAEICEADVIINNTIGRNGAKLIQAAWEKAKAEGRDRVNVLTHCNAGWLGCVDWGTALAPVYVSHDSGIPVHVWVEETRPRNQGASLTAWELKHHGVPYTIIVDNAGGHLMQHGLVDLCIVGTDRTTAHGDVCNKIGTYLKGLAARDNNVPFYVALPASTIDWTIEDGVAQIPIEERDAREVTHIRGRADNGTMCEVLLAPEGSSASNYGFDVTPARLVTGLITERGICPASPEGLLSLFPERAAELAATS
ncbi:MAG: S-methyl-5-thioribose-1-phosphate isomerase [Candidatus Methylacidiphilales bacterium]|nr:S-methyl-5-thioribose-1-phosphate isomerase [Candidatus Methylacidiphilales bacterium]